MENTNQVNQTLLNSLEKRGLLEMTKAYFRTSLLETLKKENLYNTAPMGFKSNPNQIKDKNIINLIRLQYTLINDFLIRTKMNYTQNIFNNEIKSLIESPVPYTDSELIHNLNLNINQFSNLRINSNILSSPKDLLKSTYLYQLINKHCNLIKVDNEVQTEPISDNAKNSPNLIDIEKEMKKIDEKYNKKLKMDEGLPFSKINEQKFLEYKEECDKKYENDLKNEIERFKNIELCNMRLEENKKYMDKIESIRKEYQDIYDKKYEEIKKMKDDLKKKEQNLEMEYENKILELNQQMLEQIKKNKEDNSKSNREYILEINNLNSEKKNLERTIENLQDKISNEIQSQINQIKNNYQVQLENQKNLLKEENERNQKILFNNYTKNNQNELIKSKNLINLEQINKKELGAIRNNNINYIKYSSEIESKIAEDTKNRRKILEDLEEEQNKLDKLMKYEFKNFNEETPIVFINNDEIEQIKKNEYYNNISLMNDKKEFQAKKSIEENHILRDSISPFKPKTNHIPTNASPIGRKSVNKYNNNSSMKSGSMGIQGVINMNQISNAPIEENIDNENISSSKSKEFSNKKSGSLTNNNIQSNINKNILPPINNINPNQASQSIKEEIDISSNVSKSKMGTASKKTMENMNKSNNKFNNINYNDKEDDEYGEGDFENNISSLNQVSEFNSAKKKLNNFGRIKNQSEASMMIEKINNEKEYSESYNDFENTKGLIKKGINLDTSNINNVNKFKNNSKTNNTQGSEIKEEIEYI